MSASQSMHPSLQELMLWQSGELATEVALPVSDHVAGCETCQQKLASMESIYASVAQIDPASLKRPSGSAGKRIGAAITSSVLIGTLGFLSVTQWVPEARADSLLDKAVHAEAHVPRAQHWMVHSAGGDCTLDKEPSSAARHEDGSSLCDALKMKLQASPWQSDQMLSAAAFQRWRTSLHRKHDAVHHNGPVFEVTTTSDEGPVRLASLALSAADYQPIAARFEFAESHGDAVSFSIEEAPAIREDAAVEAVVPTSPAKPLNVSTSTSLIDSVDESEARVRLALHRIGLDSSNLIAVDRDADGLRVWGMVDSASNKAKLMEAVGNMPSVRVDVFAESDPGAASAPLPWQTFRGDSMPLAAPQMQSRFAGNEQGRERFVQSVDAVTSRLVGEASSRDAMLRLVKHLNSSSDVTPLKQAASELAFKMTVETGSLAKQMQPVADMKAGQHVLTYEQAQQLYVLTHQLVFLSRQTDGLSLDDAVAQMQALLH